MRYTRQLENSSEIFFQGTRQGQLGTKAGAPTLTFGGGFMLGVGMQY